jgi:multimeric flavodoxin WrbA
MKICVINGSPKGQDSVTMQYVRFLSEAFSEHTFTMQNVGQEIHQIETKDDRWLQMIREIAASDAILWATPVYFMLVPSQLKHFIELVFARNVKDAFSGKYAASLSTSIHFFDHTAHDYLHAVSEDLGMHWAGFFSAKMEDLLSVQHQEELVGFCSDFLDTASRRPPVQRWYLPVTSTNVSYRPGPAPEALKTRGKYVMILTDGAPGSNLEKMVTRIAACFGKAATVRLLSEAGIKGGCLGCCRCAFDNTCVYTDGFSSFWRETVKKADILILAGTIRDSYLSAEWKQLFDRSFFMGHIPNFPGKQIGILVEGPFSQLATLHEVLTAYIPLQGANLCGIVTDEDLDSGVIDTRIDALADRCIRLAESGYVGPVTFPAVAGHKLFRDEIWSELRAVFKADNRYYKTHDFYDFPQKYYGQRIKTTLLSCFLNIPSIKKEAVRNMKQHMIKPYEKIFASSPVLKRMKDR